MGRNIAEKQLWNGRIFRGKDIVGPTLKKLGCDVPRAGKDIVKVASVVLSKGVRCSGREVEGCKVGHTWERKRRSLGKY